MYKIIITLVLACNLPLYTYAQGNQIEAKAAYLLAEESFAEGNYAATLEYLETATKNLGTTNSKLLYLKIQAEHELYKKDKSYYDALIKSISAFQNAADVNTFTEEKVLEIAKKKLLLIKDQEQETKLKEEHTRKKTERSEYLDNYMFHSWPFGVTLDALKIAFKKNLLFKRKVNSTIESNNGLNDRTILLHYPADVVQEGGESNMILFPLIVFQDDVYGVLTKDNIVKGYRKIIYEVNKANNKGMTQEQSLEKLKATIDNFSNYFGFEPEYQKYIRGTNITREIYRWSSEKKVVSIYSSLRFDKEGPNEGYWHTRAIQEILEK
jgi:hypothetical protein